MLTTKARIPLNGGLIMEACFETDSKTVDIVLHRQQERVCEFVMDSQDVRYLEKVIAAFRGENP